MLSSILAAIASFLGAVRGFFAYLHDESIRQGAIASEKLKEAQKADEVRKIAREAREEQRHADAATDDPRLQDDGFRRKD